MLAARSVALSAIESAGLNFGESLVVDARRANTSAIPDALHPSVRRAIAGGNVSELYRHQVEAIDAWMCGQHVVVATPTASGKTLIYAACALDALARDPSATALIICPARALVQDQHARWQKLASDAGLGNVGLIDGSVPVVNRLKLLASCRVVIATPDVVQAWFMRCAAQAAVARFLANLAVLVLDEAHIYEGVFGTNMVYLMRRFRAVAPNFRLIAGTATLDAPDAFIEQLTGIRATVIAADRDGSPSWERTFIAATTPDGADRYERIAQLVRHLAASAAVRFIVFGDSRQGVESLVDRCHSAGVSDQALLPYRAGYEDEDRKAIQSVLASGRLRGVIATSALELGIDIGDINVVVLNGPPPSMKSFHQRIGRAGRSTASAIVLVDSLEPRFPDIAAFLGRPLEPNHVYLDNRRIQYANALCAVHEIHSVRGHNRQVFDSLPKQFVDFVEAERAGSWVPDDLLELRQRGGNSPHHQFPLRSAGERTFKVVGPHDQALGEVTHAQLMREAFPGAIYRYIGRAFRIIRIDLRNSTVHAVKCNPYIRVKPSTLANVFPQPPAPSDNVGRSGTLTACDSLVQVSIRVTGFREEPGGRHEYGQGSSYSQQPLDYLFRTSGVYIYAHDGRTIEVGAAELLRRAVAIVHGIHERDLGAGHFHATAGVLAATSVRGICVYDAVEGSLRLSARLTERTSEIFAEARHLATVEGASDGTLESLAMLEAGFAGMTFVPRSQAGVAMPSAGAVALVPGTRYRLRIDALRTEDVTLIEMVETDYGELARIEAPARPGQPPVTRMVKPDRLEPCIEPDDAAASAAE